MEKIMIKEIFKEATYTGGIGNAEVPLLCLKKVEPSTCTLFFGFDYDYSQNNCCFKRAELEEILKNSNINELKLLSSVSETVRIQDIFCSMKVQKEDLVEMEKQLYVFSMLNEQKGITEYKNVSVVAVNKKTNISSSAYELNYVLNNFVITLDARARIGSGVNDLKYIGTEKIAPVLKQLGEFASIQKDIEKALNIDKNDFSILCNCFNYKVCNDHAVIVELKEELEPLHLLQFDGFLSGYTHFKIEYNGHNGTFTMIKNHGKDYWTVVWGTSTTMTHDYVWKMRDSIIECIRIKCLMF